MSYEEEGYEGWKAEATAEIQRLRQWVADLQAGYYVNCVFCGHRYGPAESTPTSIADVLKAHVQQCERHPMFDRTKLLERIVGYCKARIEKHGEDALYPIQVWIEEHLKHWEKGNG